MCEMALLLGMFVMGIIALAKGEIQLSKKQKVRGAPTRMIGLPLMIPLSASFGTGFVYGIEIAMRQQEIRDMPQWLNFIGAGSAVVCVVASFFIALMASKPNAGSDSAPGDLDAA